MYTPGAVCESVCDMLEADVEQQTMEHQRKRLVLPPWRQPRTERREACVFNTPPCCEHGM